jgi:predicted nucleotidyltransferase component of viral defense system
MIHPALADMIDRYQAKSLKDYHDAVREIVQEIALLGLGRTLFYDHAAFYGGSALRIFHGLQRFSEDLDFTLLKSEPGFSFGNYLGSVSDELAAWGFDFKSQMVEKATPSAIESAFMKGNTVVNLLQIGAPSEIAERLPKNQLIHIKLEIDTDPPPGAKSEISTRLIPTPHQVRVYQLPSLFAGKLHAVLARKWKDRVKGRDFYDLVWYVGRRIPVNLGHLEARLRQSGDWSEAKPLDRAALDDLLRNRFAMIDFDQAKNDVLPFILDARELELWSLSFFESLIPQIEIEGK